MVKRYVDKNCLLSMNEPFEKGNAIVLGVTLPACSYQPFDFGASQVITARAAFLNSKTGLYFVSVIKKAISIFSYTNKPGIEKYKNLKIPLPTIDNEIAFDYIEQYVREVEAERVREVEAERVREVEAYLIASGLNDYQLTKQEKEVLEPESGGYKPRFKEFRLGDLFEKLSLKSLKIINKRKDVSAQKTSEFNLPLVNAKHGDNGIMYYGRSSDWESATMTIDIVNDGAVSTGDVYPQPQLTGVLYNAYLIKPKFTPTEELLLYFSQTIQKSIKPKYGYDAKATWERVQNDEIILPVNELCNLDLTYMQTYISAMKKLVIADVVKWKDRELDALRQACNLT